VYTHVAVTGPGFVSVKFKLSPANQIVTPPKKILVDYCGVNVAKQMHIGHIRSMFIGDFVVRLHKKLGDEVVIHNHIGDWGNQFGYLLHYIIQNKLQDDLTNKNLTAYYKAAYAQNNSDEEFSLAASKVAQDLQKQSDSTVVNLWKKLVSISMAEAEKTFKELSLKVDLSHTQGESFYAPFCQSLLLELLDKKIATENEDGSVVVFFEDKSPLVLQKTNGNFLYALYDLAAIKWRNDFIKPDKIIYVVDKRQALHFEQIFEIAKKASLVDQSVELLHLGFGTILGKDKKPLKTKEGESLYLDELLAQGKDILSNNSYFMDMPMEIKTEVLHKTLVGGMKYYDLKFNKMQDYIFDWEHVFNFSGNSAPYIQNALVRIDSIYTKCHSDIMSPVSVSWSFDWNELEQELLFRCQKTQEMLTDSVYNYPSQLVTEHAIKICQLFHKYYEAEKIIGNVNELYKLQLIGFVYQTLSEICAVLGIETYRCLIQMEKDNSLK
jgi:arginyl-tRNA synthetase